jgi:hypothetical protein
MKASPYAKKPAEASMLVNVPRLIMACYTEMPDPSVPEQRIAFGTSDHRGSAFAKACNEWDILRYLSVAILYIFQHRPKWREGEAAGKMVVSGQMIDRITEKLGLRLYEVPVGFNWFMDGLLDSSLGFGGRARGGIFRPFGWQRLDNGYPGFARGGDCSTDGPRSGKGLPQTHTRNR